MRRRRRTEGEDRRDGRRDGRGEGTREGDGDSKAEEGGYRADGRGGLSKPLTLTLTLTLTLNKRRTLESTGKRSKPHLGGTIATSTRAFSPPTTNPSHAPAPCTLTPTSAEPSPHPLERSLLLTRADLMSFTTCSSSVGLERARGAQQRSDHQVGRHERQAQGQEEEVEPAKHDKDQQRVIWPVRRWWQLI